MNKNSLPEILHATEIFSEFPGEVLKELALRLTFHHLKKDETIIHKGDEGKSMFIIVNGELNIHDGEHIVATMNRGNFFGEFSLLDAAPRSMSVSATTDAELIGIDRESFYSVIHEHPELTKKIIAQLTKRMRVQSNVIISQLKSKEQELIALVEERTAELKNKNIEITQKNKEIVDSIQYAKRLQEAILPPEKVIKNYFPESFVLYLPKDIVAGDFYWIEHTGNQVLIAATDCTGHGVPGALMSMIGVSLLNQIVKEKGISTPKIILEQLHNSIIKALKQTENDSHDGMDIALCSFNFKNNELQFAGANRPLWIVRDNLLITITPDKLPIGGLQIEIRPSFTNHLFSFQKNDIIYLFTDGYADQFGGKEGKKLMTKNFKEALIYINGKSMDEQKSYLQNHFQSWKAGNEQVDDVLIIGIKI